MCRKGRGRGEGTLGMWKRGGGENGEFYRDLKGEKGGEKVD